MYMDDTTEFLIKAAVLEGDGAVNAWASATRERAPDYLAGHTLAPAIYRNLSSLGIPDHQLHFLREAHTRTWAMNQLLTRSAQDATQILSANNFDFVLLKGAALGLRVYGDIGARRLTDVDVLVRHSCRLGAIQALTKNNYKCVFSNRKLQAVMSHLHSAAFRKDNGGEIDIHWNLLRTSCWSDADEMCWGRAIKMDWQGTAALALCDTDHLFHTMSHAFASEIYGNTASPIWMVDAALLIERQQIDWQEFERLCAERRLASSVLIQSQRLNKVLGYTAMPPSTVSFLKNQRVFFCEHMEALSRRNFALRFRRQLNAVSQYIRLRQKNNIPSFIHFLKVDWMSSSWWEFGQAILKRFALFFRRH